LLLCKKSTLFEKSADGLLTSRNIPGDYCQRSAFFVIIAVKWSNFFLHRMGKALCERLFALYRQQPGKYKQNVDVAPLKNFCGRQ